MRRIHIHSQNDSTESANAVQNRQDNPSSCGPISVIECLEL